MLSKKKTEEEIVGISKDLSSNGKRIVTTNGSFDILHPAHIRLFDKAKKQGDTLIVLLNSDASIKKLKGDDRPIQNEKDRSTMLAALTNVDFVVIFDEDNPLRLLEKIRPNIHVKGGSFIQERNSQEKALLNSWGGEFKNFEFEDEHATTKIIDKILENK